jgi:hypothetical protein
MGNIPPKSADKDDEDVHKQEEQAILFQKQRVLAQSIQARTTRRYLPYVLSPAALPVSGTGMRSGFS